MLFSQSGWRVSPLLSSLLRFFLIPCLVFLSALIASVCLTLSGLLVSDPCEVISSSSCSLFQPPVTHRAAAETGKLLRSAPPYEHSCYFRKNWRGRGRRRGGATVGWLSRVSNCETEPRKKHQQARLMTKISPSRWANRNAGKHSGRKGRFLDKSPQSWTFVVLRPVLIMFKIVLLALTVSSFSIIV